MQLNAHKIIPWRGFTLIELLVVLVIVGVLLASIVVKTLPDQRQILRQEATRLGLLLEHAREEAFLSGRSIAWSAQNERYGFWRLNAERQWTPITNHQTLRLRSLAPAVRLAALTISQVKVPLSERLVFSPSGLNTPFVATLALHDHQLRLVGDHNGQVKIEDEH